MKLFIVVFALFSSILACSMGGHSVVKRELFKSLFYMGDKVGHVYKKECPKNKRYKNGRCKRRLVKRLVNFCDPDNFKNFKEERYILVKETDFLM